MPLDIPREDNFDDSWPDIPGYQVMNIANEDNDGGDSDFEFSSDEEDANATVAADVQQDRYANYELINQLDNGVAEPEALEEDEANETEGENNQAINRFFQHNFVVQWIETDEPLFDRQQFEARQAGAGNVPNTTQSETLNQSSGQDSVSVDSSTESSVQEPSSSQQTLESEQPQLMSGQNRKDDVKMDKEQIDIIKGLMSNFKLPEESVPGWAKDIPEDQWKTFLNNKFDDEPTV